MRLGSLIHVRVWIEKTPDHRMVIRAPISFQQTSLSSSALDADFPHLATRAAHRNEPGQREQQRARLGNHVVAARSADKIAAAQGEF